MTPTQPDWRVQISQTFPNMTPEFKSEIERLVQSVANASYEAGWKAGVDDRETFYKNYHEDLFDIPAVDTFRTQVDKVLEGLKCRCEANQRLAAAQEKIKDL